MALLPSRRRETVPTLDALRREMNREMNRLYDDFFGLDWGEGPFWREPGVWVPSLDIAETDDGVEVKAEVPGIAPKEIEVTVSGDMLTIKGEKKREKEEKEKAYHCIERSYGSFLRNIALPPGTDASRVTAAFDKGLLTVKLPRKEEAKKQAVTVEVKETKAK